MKKLSDMVPKVDSVIDKNGKTQLLFKKKYFVFLGATVLVGFLALFIWTGYKEQTYFSSIVIKKELHEIYKSIKQIDDDCNILSFDQVVNTVDFLTVEKFLGSEVGGLNLAYPKNWNGPYLTYTPVLQGKPFLIIKTDTGLFIVPGNDVKLPNGLVIGTDFVFNAKSNINEMIKPEGKLSFEGQSLAVKIDFVIGDWDSVFKKKKENLKNLKSMVDEFNEAMPFTKNESNVEHA